MIFVANNHAWELVTVSSDNEILRRSDGSYTLGVTDNSTKTVTISNAVAGTYMFIKVLTHEMVHVFCFEHGCDFDLETEEKLADFVATYGRDIINLADDLISKKIRIA